MKNSKISANWEYVIPEKGKTICQLVGAKKVKDLEIYPDCEVYFRDYGEEFIVTQENKKDFADAVVCTKCSIFSKIHPNFNIDYDLSYEEGRGCLFSLGNTIDMLTYLEDKIIVNECMKNRDPRGLLELASMIENFVAEFKKKRSRTIVDNEFLWELETRVRWFRTIAGYGISLKVTNQ